MKRRKRFRKRKAWQQQPSREDLHHGGLHARGTCSADCGAAANQKWRLWERRRRWYRWLGKPGERWASCARSHPDAVAPLRTLMYV